MSSVSTHLVQVRSITMKFINLMIASIHIVIVSTEFELVSIDKCNVSNPGLVEMKKCEKVDDKCLDIYAFLHKPITEMWLTAEISNLRGEKYKKMFKSDPIEWCQVMSGSKTNRFLKGLLDSIKKTIPEFFHK